MRLLFGIACLAVTLTASVAAHAQTCASPAHYQGSFGGPSVAGTTCGGDTTAAGYCAGNLDAPGPAYVMQSTINENRMFTDISLTGGPGYDALILMSPVSGGCGTNAACTATGDPGSPIPSTDVPNGEYFIIVTAATFDAPGACGTFTVTSGPLPVELQEFTID